MNPSVTSERQAEDQHDCRADEHQLRFEGPEDRPLVGEGRYHRLEGPEDGAEGEGDHHQEEESGPDLRARDLGDNLRVDDECQSGVGSEDVLDFLAGDVGHVAEDGENHEPGEDAGDGVADGDDDGVPVAVSLELAVGGESDETATGCNTTLSQIWTD